MSYTLRCHHCDKVVEVSRSAVKRYNKLKKIKPNHNYYCPNCTRMGYHFQHLSDPSNVQGISEKLFIDQLVKWLGYDKVFIGAKFGHYDCDIAIPELRLAIHWNGCVHFSSDKKKSIEEKRITEIRKYAEIREWGYDNYVINRKSKKTCKMNMIMRHVLRIVSMYHDYYMTLIEN